MFFIYAPIYGVASGLDEMASATMVSMGAASMFLVPMWGWVGRRYGLRLLLAAGYTLTGVMSMAVMVADAGALAGAGEPGRRRPGRRHHRRRRQRSLPARRASLTSARR